MPTVVLTNTYDAGDRRTQVTATVGGGLQLERRFELVGRLATWSPASGAAVGD
jgi:hypothetical protein